ncbi:murein hydrolase activator EnvC family protein [Pelagibacterium lacus]|uniref:murein hydrolase activator EnvC family protein n=1 Tax=Pelagibacterium lacus TaxID=2282655 RepID=UPI001314DD59|nr:peptidoglycan DD-metalloendopeptidase family protein [Pelagibacterium lacus]
MKSVGETLIPFLGTRRRSLLALAALAGLFPMAAAGQDTEAGPAPENIPNAELDDASLAAQSDLQTVEDTMALTAERIAEIRAEIEALDSDAAQLALELTAASQRIDLASDDVRVIEERLEELFASEREIGIRLDGHDRSISNLLASLQRITAQPPPAIIVDPSDALASARAAMLLGSVLPQMQARADRVTEDLNAIAQVKRSAQEEAGRLRANLATLNEERLRIATVIEARKQGLEWLSDDLLREEAEARALSDRATSLEQLIAGLQTRIDAVTAADEATAAANVGSDVPTLDAETLRVAFSDTSRTEPAVPLAAAKGHLTPPLAGALVAGYGAADGFGGTSKGQLIAAQPGQTVLAPADGWVSYAGLFLNYGQIVILNAGQDYTVVLAGLESVDVERGQFVQMGTGIGTMGTETPPAEIRPDFDGPALYFELRQGETPINPQGWWVAQPQEQQESGTN